MRIVHALVCLLAMPSCLADDEPAAIGETTAELSSHAIARASLLASDAVLATSITVFGEVDGVWPWLAADASYLHPGVPVITGRDEIRDFLRATYPDRAAQTLRLHGETGDASSDATLGYTFGWFDEDVTTADGGRATRFGKYLATWTRGLGPWQLAGLVRVPGTREPSPPPAGAAIFAGDHGVASWAGARAARAQAFDADRRFATLSVARGYTVAFTTHGAVDAVVVGAGDFYWNAAGVAYAWGGWSPVETLDWVPSIGRGAASGDLAYTIGTATYALDTGGGIETSSTKYLTVWVREADGTWRFLLDGGND